MNLPLYIAKHLYSKNGKEKSLSSSIIKIALFGIVLGMIVMIIALGVVMGFKEEIQKRVSGFAAQVQILNYDSNSSFETIPISKKQSFYPSISKSEGITHIQVFATKAGIIKTKTDIQGVILKGISSDYDWSFFKNHMVEGSVLAISDSIRNNNILISKHLSNLLKINLGDKITMGFIEEPPRFRRFTVTGIYQSSLMEFDKAFVIGDIKHIQRLNNWTRDQISGFEVLIDDFGKIAQRTKEISEEIGIQISENGQMLKTTNVINKYPYIFDWLKLHDINVWVLMILIIMVTGINMISGLFILILEQTRMIGILKTLGAKNTLIRKIFLYKSGLLIAKALFWGNVIGLTLCLIQKYTQAIKLDPTTYFIEFVPIKFSWLLIATLNISTIILILAMLVVPSYLISKISPAKTIRFE